jgi:DNA-binding NtrC family response regulator
LFVGPDGYPQILLKSQKKGEGPLRESLEYLERKLILEAMEKVGEQQTKAVNLLGISERMLRYKLKKYGLKGQALPPGQTSS